MPAPRLNSRTSHARQRRRRAARLKYASPQAQPLGDVREHRRELREDQEAVAALDGLLDELLEHVELARATVIALEEQGGITGDLAQAREDTRP